MITLDDINNAENAIKNIRVALQTIGRELHQMRSGEVLGPEYGFDDYSRENFAGSEYAGQEGPDWGVGTPIFSLRYYWPRAENAIYVTFPQGWLEQDWKALETKRLSEERSVLAAIENARTEQNARDREISERRSYERLKAKFEK